MKSLFVKSQTKKFFYVGQLMAMSLVQGGSGFPFLAPPVYKYLCGQNIEDILVTFEDISDIEISMFLTKVSTLSLMKEGISQ